MSKYYWKGGPYSGSSLDYYSITESYPSSYCWNVASNWFVRVEGNTGNDGSTGSSTGGWHLVPATTPPGGGDLVFFEKFDIGKASAYGATYAFPLTPCLFGGYITDWNEETTPGWIGASSTGGFVSVVIQPEYGERINLGPAQRIGCGYAEYLKIRSDYLDAGGGATSGGGVTFAGVNWPTGIDGFGGLRLNARSIRDFHSQPVMSASGATVSPRFEMYLHHSICSAFVSEASPSRYNFIGGTYTQMFFNDIPHNDPSFMDGIGHGIQSYGDNSTVMGERQNASITDYLYLGDILGGTASTNGSANFKLSTDIERVDIDPVTGTTIYNTGVTPVIFTLSGATLGEVNVYPRTKLQFDPIKPYGGYGPILFEGSSADNTQGTITKLTLHESSTDDPNRTIIDRGYYFWYTGYIHPSLGGSGDNFAGVNNPTILNNVVVNTLNLDGGRVGLIDYMSENDSVEIQNGRIGSESVLDLIPTDPFVTGIKIGSGTSHPRAGAGLMISPVGGQIKLPLQMRFVADYKTGKGPTFEVGLPGIGPSRPR